MLEKYPHKEVAYVGTANGSKPVYLLDINGKNVVFYLSAIGSALAGNDIIEISWQTGIIIKSRQVIKQAGLKGQRL